MRRSVIAAGTTLGLLALAGCSSGGSSHTSATSAGGGSGLAAPGAVRDLGGTKSAAGPASTKDRVTIGPVRILTADLTLRAKSGAEVAQIATKAGDMAVAAGGEVAGDQRTEAGSETQADLVLKVPQGKYDVTLERMSKLGRELSRSAQAEDVTDQVVDVASRVSSQEASVARIRKLLTGARNIGDVVQIEGELAKREADLESLKARQRALDGQTTFATITLHVRGPKAAVTTPRKPPRGFLAGLTAGWESFTKATTWLLTAVGALLPYLILAALVGAVVRVVRRRRQPARPGSAPEPAAVP